MEEIIIPLGLDDEAVQLEGYRGNGTKPAIIVLPGGAYAACAEGEGRPVAKYFAGLGYCAFVLRYSTLWPDFSDYKRAVNKHTIFPEPLIEVAHAVKYLKENAKELGGNGNVAICGFSAGGHLTASYGNGWNGKEIADALHCDTELLRPFCQILSYSVTKLRNQPKVTMNRAIFGHWDEAPTNEEFEERSPIFNIGLQTPPTFIWHSAADEMVNVTSSIEMASTLKEKSIPFELHVYSGGPHATGLSDGLPAETWKKEAVRFMERYEKEIR